MTAIPQESCQYCLLSSTPPETIGARLVPPAGRYLFGLQKFPHVYGSVNFLIYKNRTEGEI